MKEHVQKTGVRKYAGDDLIELQAEPLKALQKFFEEYGMCIIRGCGVTPAGDQYNVAPGMVGLSGTDADGNAAYKVVPFAGVENVSLPIYLTLTHTVCERAYADQKVKPIAYNYTATASGVMPAEGVPFLEITAAGGRRFVDAVKITEKLEKVGNGKDVTVTFSEAATRENITSGEKLSVLFGKVCKWFASLATIAWTGKAADLAEDATHRFVSDAEKGNWNSKAAGVHDHNKSQITDFPSSMPASDVYAWAKQPAKPGYSASEVGAAIAGHNHDSVYQPVGSYAAASHSHPKNQITDFPASMPASDVYAWAKQPAKPGYSASEVGAAIAGHNHDSVYQPVGSYAAASHSHPKNQITDFPTSMPASDVYAWAKQPAKPGYSASEVGAAIASHNHAGTYAPVSHNHSAGQINEEVNKRFMTDAERSKLAGIEASANRYVHPGTHPASMITDAGGKVMMTLTERSTLANIASTFLPVSNYSGNVNDITTSGIYILRSCSNVPVGEGGTMLIHLTWDINSMHQIFFSVSTSNMYNRSKLMTWGRWRWLNSSIV